MCAITSVLAQNCHGNPVADLLAFGKGTLRTNATRSHPYQVALQAPQPLVDADESSVTAEVEEMPEPFPRFLPPLPPTHTYKDNPLKPLVCAYLPSTPVSQGDRGGDKSRKVAKLSSGEIRGV